MPHPSVPFSSSHKNASLHIRYLDYEENKGTAKKGRKETWKQTHSGAKCPFSVPHACVLSVSACHWELTTLWAPARSGESCPSLQLSEAPGNRPPPRSAPSRPLLGVWYRITPHPPCPRRTLSPPSPVAHPSLPGIQSHSQRRQGHQGKRARRHVHTHFIRSDASQFPREQLSEEKTLWACWSGQVLKWFFLFHCTTPNPYLPLAIPAWSCPAAS